MLQQLQTQLGEVAAPDADAPLPEGLAHYAEHISAADSEGWQLQDQLVERMPEALKSAFVEVEAEFFRSPARVRLLQQGAGELLLRSVFQVSTTLFVEVEGEVLQPCQAS